MELKGIMLFVKDMKTVIAFYRDVIGLTPDEDQPFPEHRFFRFNAGACTLCLHSASKPNEGRQKLMFHVESVSAVHQHIKSKGKRLRKLENERWACHFRYPRSRRQPYSVLRQLLILGIFSQR